MSFNNGWEAMKLSSSVSILSSFLVLLLAGGCDDGGGTLSEDQDEPTPSEEVAGSDREMEPEQELPLVGELMVSHEELNFVDVQAGQSHQATVTLTNIGDGPVYVSNIIIYGSRDFSVSLDGEASPLSAEQIDDLDGDGESGLSPYDQESGVGRVTLVIKYEPSAVGTDEGILTIDSDVLQQPTIEIPLLGNALSAEPNACLNINPEAVQFDGSLVNRVDYRAVDLRGCGQQPVNISEIYLEGETDYFELEYTFDLPLALSDEEDQTPKSVAVVFTPLQETTYNAQLVIVSDDPINPERRIDILGRGTSNQCPIAVIPMTQAYAYVDAVVSLDGSESYDPDGPNQEPVGYEWVVTSRPEGSTRMIVEEFDNPDRPELGGPRDLDSTPTAQFLPDLPGDYTLALIVRDGFGLDSLTCNNEALMTLTVRDR